MTDRTRLVVVGAGIAGLEVATRLARRHDRSGRFAVTLIDRALAHVWKPGLHTVAAGTVRSDRARIGLFAHAARHGYRFRPGTLAGVDLAAKTVRLVPYGLAAGDEGGGDHGAADQEVARSVSYDALVLAIGSRANDFGTPGVAAHCRFLDDLADAQTLHERLRLALIRAAERGDTLRVAIVGGGATGVELAAELHRALDAARRGGAELTGPVLQLTLIESGARLLPAFPPAIADGAARTLKRLGVTVMTGARVTGADANGFALADGGRVEASIRIWAAGVRAPAALDAMPTLERGKNGTLLVDGRLRTTRDRSVFALGDCASIGDGPSVPPTAQAARQEALWFVAHAPALVGGGMPPPFRYRDRGSVLALGDYNGWGTLGRYSFGGGVLRGLSARVAHQLLYRQHQFAIQGAGRGTLVWAADALDEVARGPVEM